MPDGTAQKPGDIVKSMSGQTIEIQNTDAEGRLVLADALWYAQDKYKPEIMIDLATLTGAIVMSLGNKMAGIFSNNDDLSNKLLEAGRVSGDNVWRLPLSESYDKMINSQFADMKKMITELILCLYNKLTQGLEGLIGGVLDKALNLAGLEEKAKAAAPPAISAVPAATWAGAAAAPASVPCSGVGGIEHAAERSNSPLCCR